MDVVGSPFTEKAGVARVRRMPQIARCTSNLFSKTNGVMQKMLMSAGAFVVMNMMGYNSMMSIGAAAAVYYMF